MTDLEEEERAARETREIELDQSRQVAKQAKLDAVMTDNWQDIPLPDFPPGATLKEIAEACEHIAMMTLLKVAYAGQSETARIAEANSILDRSVGKPVQQQHLIVANVDFSSMLDDMLAIRKGVYIEAGDTEEAELIN